MKEALILATNKIIKIIIAVLSILLALSLATLIFVMVRLYSIRQTASDTVTDNYISPEAHSESTFDYEEKEGNTYAY